MIYITRKEHFSSSHKLENPDLSNEKNEDLFGKCNNFHGHNYYIEVTLAGTPDPESNYVMDLKLLKKIIHENILDKVDHKYLNQIDMFKDVIPTTENMVLKFWDAIEPKVKRQNVNLYSIKIYETEKNYVEYRGENN
ncbi:MAG: 6-carboxytetrahydropterin synthase [Bacteroidota bacterium]|nr:6-carboxytetrahydropterin synthase [Bacteroidota bacterium]